MSAINDGGAAYPQHGWSSNPDVVAQMQGKQGMSLRDHFAGLALSSIVGLVAIDQPTEDMLLKAGVKTEEFPSFAAQLCYDFADAMIEARKEVAQ